MHNNFVFYSLILHCAPIHTQTGQD